VKDWKNHLNYDPIKPLINVKNDAINYMTKRDLLEEEVEPPKTLWNMPEPKNILHKQQENGSWNYPGKSNKDVRTQENYSQLETYRNLSILHEKYGINKDFEPINSAVDYILSFQTDEGDIRGIYENQYSPNYTAAIIEILLKMGFSDVRIENALTWLMSIRQEDGGWASPIRTNKANWNEVIKGTNVLQPNRSRPFSHLITGVVLRVFAVHPKYRDDIRVQEAGRLLSSRFFKIDKYPDRRGPEYWTKFSFPFWFTDLLSSLDSLYLIGFTKNDENIKIALDWLANKQENDGSWNLKLLKTKDKDLKFWISYVITRTFKRFYC